MRWSLSLLGRPLQVPVWQFNRSHAVHICRSVDLGVDNARTPTDDCPTIGAIGLGRWATAHVCGHS